MKHDIFKVKPSTGNSVSDHAQKGMGLDPPHSTGTINLHFCRVKKIPQECNQPATGLQSENCKQPKNYEGRVVTTSEYKEISDLISAPAVSRKFFNTWNR
ncbi:hypothetical protein SLE2022_092210 [Rubroshorea leprosula]